MASGAVRELLQQPHELAELALGKIAQAMIEYFRRYMRNLRGHVLALVGQYQVDDAPILVAALALQKRRYDAGMLSDFELRQLESEVAAAQAQLPQLERRRLAQHTALAVLLGRTPKEIVEERASRNVQPASDAGRASTPVQLVVPADRKSTRLNSSH